MYTILATRRGPSVSSEPHDLRVRLRLPPSASNVFFAHLVPTFIFLRKHTSLILLYVASLSSKRAGAEARRQVKS